MHGIPFRARTEFQRFPLPLQPRLCDPPHHDRLNITPITSNTQVTNHVLNSSHG
jgi:hypothetical protein